MKRILPLLLLLLAGWAQAQPDVHYLQSSRTAWAFGLRAGVNFANVNWSRSTTERKEGKQAVYLGFVYDRPLSGRWSLQPALYYSPQGYRLLAPDNGSLIYYDANRLIGYLNIPVLLGYNLPAGLSFKTGPQAGLLIGSNGYEEEQGADFSWVAGVAFTGKKGFGGELTFIQGLKTHHVSFYDYTYPTPNYDSYTYRHQVFQAGLVYFFAIAKKRPVH